MALIYGGLSIHNFSQFKKSCTQYGTLAPYCIKHLDIWSNEANWTERDYKSVAKYVSTHVNIYLKTRSLQKDPAGLQLNSKVLVGEE